MISATLSIIRWRRYRWLIGPLRWVGGVRWSRGLRGNHPWMGPHVRWGWHHGVEKPPGTRLSWNTRHLPPPSSLLLSPSSLSRCTVTQHIHSGREGERERREGGRKEGESEISSTNFYFLQLRGTCNNSNLLFLHIYTCLCLQERSTVSFINPRACAGGFCG